MFNYYRLYFMLFYMSVSYIYIPVTHTVSVLHTINGGGKIL